MCPRYYDPEGALAELDALHKAEHFSDSDSDDEEKKERRQVHPSYHLGGTITPRLTPNP